MMRMSYVAERVSAMQLCAVHVRHHAAKEQHFVKGHCSWNLQCPSRDALSGVHMVIAKEMHMVTRQRR